MGDKHHTKQDDFDRFRCDARKDAMKEFDHHLMAEPPRIADAALQIRNACWACSRVLHDVRADLIRQAEAGLRRARLALEDAARNVPGPGRFEPPFSFDEWRDRLVNTDAEGRASLDRDDPLIQFWHLKYSAKALEIATENPGDCVPWFDEGDWLGSWYRGRLVFPAGVLQAIRFAASSDPELIPAALHRAVGYVMETDTSLLCSGFHLSDIPDLERAIDALDHVVPPKVKTPSPAEAPDAVGAARQDPETEAPVAAGEGRKPRGRPRDSGREKKLDCGKRWKAAREQDPKLTYKDFAVANGCSEDYARHAADVFRKDRKKAVKR